MTTDNKRGLFQRIQAFMGSYHGKVILNYAYSWGAAIVILGALFKLTHMPGANLMLWIGMGTEVLVFFVSAFDLPNAGSSSSNGNQQPNINIVGDTSSLQGNKPVVQNTSAPITITTVSGGGGSMGNMPSVSPEMEEATAAYLMQLKEMTETLTRFTNQATLLSQDAEQINILNKNLSGINAIYEMQLRSVSSQIGTIDQVHEQTRKMARQIEELNTVYARMLEAMNGNSK